MFKILLIIFIFINLYSKEFLNDKYIQIIAKKVETKNNIVNASGDIIIYTKEYYITAQKLIYNKKTNKVELFGDVSVVKNNDTVSFSQHLLIDMQKDKKQFKPILFFNKKSQLWFTSKTADINKDNYLLDTTTLSSCDCEDPAWSIRFSSGDFNTTNQWVNTYHTTLYLNNFPILYTPYFGFPTDKTRRSGLLRPTIGFAKSEGLLYAQPLYYAPSPNFDFEYIPQVRLIRGHGNALKYRYKDSLYSTLKIETAEFIENSEYQEEQKLINNKHYGWDFEYKRTNLFAKKINAQTHRDGLLIKSLDMNDVDYYNTKYDRKVTTYTNKFLESKIKYFYNTSHYYTDLELKSYNDISKKNNDDILQTIPNIKSHRYLDNILFKHLTTSIDIDYISKKRKIGLGANITNVALPISYSSYIFKDYLNFKVEELFDLTDIDYTNEENNEFKDASYILATHKVSIDTDLLKGYDDLIHSIKFRTSYEKTEELDIQGDLYGITNNDNKLENFLLNKQKETIKLGFDQSFYDNKSLKQIIKHRLDQLYIYDDTTDKFIETELNNELSIFYQYGTMTNKLQYSHKLKQVVSSTTSLDYQNNGYNAKVLYSDISDKKTGDVKSRVVTYNIGFDLYKYYKIRYMHEYDIMEDIVKKREYGFNIDKKCWAVDFKLIDSLVATNRTDNQIIRQNIFYVELNLKQLFKLNQKYVFDKRAE